MTTHPTRLFGTAGRPVGGKGCCQQLSGHPLRGPSSKAIFPSWTIPGHSSPRSCTLWSLNFLTGVTPGRLFQTACSLSAGHWAASSASSFWLLKLANGVAVAAAASSGAPCAVVLFSLSMVNVIWSSPFSALIAVITSITPICLKSKVILLLIDDGEERAMVWGSAGRWYQVEPEKWMNLPAHAHSLRSRTPKRGRSPTRRRRRFVSFLVRRPEFRGLLCRYRQQHAFAAEAVFQPAAHGQNDGIGYQVRGKDPSGFIRGGRKVPRNMRQADVDSGSVQQPLPTNAVSALRRRREPGAAPRCSCRSSSSPVSRPGNRVEA